MRTLLRKMKSEFAKPVRYFLNVEGNEVLVNDWVGKQVQIRFTGTIICVSCQKKIKKTFQDGFCFSCFQTSPNASECIIRPELCRAHLGEGRDVIWEEENHNQPHIVYLAASSVVKVGVTRLTQVPYRWIDQGATCAIKLAETPNRYEAGKIEVALKSMFTDRTNWQKMLKNEVDESIDLEEVKWELHEQLPADITDFYSDDDEISRLIYPVLKYPEKVKSLSLDKLSEINAQLMGVKGQYLLFEGGLVLNIRKHKAYEVDIQVS